MGDEPKIGVENLPPKSSICSLGFPWNKPSILGYLYFWKHPYWCESFLLSCSFAGSLWLILKLRPRQVPRNSQHSIAVCIRYLGKKSEMWQTTAEILTWNFGGLRKPFAPPAQINRWWSFHHRYAQKLLYMVQDRGGRLVWPNMKEAHQQKDDFLENPCTSKRKKFSTSVFPPGGLASIVFFVKWQFLWN